MEYRLKEKEGKIEVEGRTSENTNFGLYAGFDEESRLIFYGDLPDKMCDEIIEFLHTKCIHVDEKGFGCKLVN